MINCKTHFFLPTICVKTIPHGHLKSSLQSILVACRYISSNESCISKANLAQTRMRATSLPLLSVQRSLPDKSELPCWPDLRESSQAGWRSEGLHDGSWCPQLTCAVCFTSGKLTRGDKFNRSVTILLWWSNVSG